MSCHQSFRSASAFTRHQMVAGCPDNKGTVSDIAEAVNVALVAYIAAQNERGDYRYLVLDENHGIVFWRWNAKPED